MSRDLARFHNDVRQKIQALTKLMFSEHIGTIKTRLWVILKTASLDFFWISFAFHIWNHYQLTGGR